MESSVSNNEEESQQARSFNNAVSLGDDLKYPIDADGDNDSEIVHPKSPKMLIYFDADTDIENQESPSEGDDYSTSDAKDANNSVSPNLIGGTYTQHELAFVMVSGVLLAFNAGYINGSCLSGFLTSDGVKQSASSVTGYYTRSALALADGNFEFFGFQVFMILSLIFGACISGMMNANAQPYRIEPSYGPTFMVGGIFLLIASLLAAVEVNGTHSFFFAAAANGIQNGMSSIYSANLIRSTHLTGTSTDIGLFIGQLIRGNREHSWKLLVLLSLSLSFWLGGVVSFFATAYFTSYSLLFNAGLFILIGASLVYFLVHELHVSVSAALLGTWMWKRVMKQIVENDMRNSKFDKSHHLTHYFDNSRNNDEDEIITEQNLLEALRAAGVDINEKEVKVLIRKAEGDNNGNMSKQSWKRKVARACRRKSQ
jgi:uncharacterized membrane protein YoaK (UPF0700 family)